MFKRKGMSNADTAPHSTRSITMTITEMLEQVASAWKPLEELEELGCYQIGEGYSRTVWATPCGEYVIKVNMEGVDNEAGAQNWAEWETYEEASEAARVHLAECVDITSDGVFMVMRRLIADGSEAKVKAFPALAAEGLEFEELGCAVVGGIQIAYDYAERTAA